MPKQDAFGRWMTDDGMFYWDGNAWRPAGTQAPAGRGVSVAQPILIGAGFVLAIIVLLSVGIVIMFQEPVMQQSFCNGWDSGQHGSKNIACPFHPTSP